MQRRAGEPQGREVVPEKLAQPRSGDHQPALDALGRGLRLGQTGKTTGQREPLPAFPDVVDPDDVGDEQTELRRVDVRPCGQQAVQAAALPVAVRKVERGLITSQRP